MHPREFIQINTQRELIKLGFTGAAVTAGVNMAATIYDKTPSFPAGKCYDTCFAAGKKTARLYQRDIDKAAKAAEREAKASAKASAKAAAKTKPKPKATRTRRPSTSIGARA
jgi:hypothetical protein